MRVRWFSLSLAALSLAGLGWSAPRDEASDGRGDDVYVAPGFEYERLALLPFNGFSVALDLHGESVYITDKQSGRIWIYRDRAVLDQPVWDFAVSFAAERGLIGLALHPQFPTPPQLFAFYSASPLAGQDDGQAVPIEGNRLVRLTLDGDVGVSEELLARFDANEQGFHNSGNLHFDAEGYLWISVGDMIRHWTTPPYPFDLRRPQGKLLRIDVDHPEPPLAYGIPADNPFATDGDPNTMGEIFAFGFRNPFNFTFHPVYGTVYVTENGNVIEDEINVVVAGKNYGWPRVQGPADTMAEQEFVDATPNYVGPIWSSGDVTVCPVGLIVATGQLGLGRHLIYGECNSPQKMWAVELTGDRDEQLTGEPLLLMHGNGRPLDMKWDARGDLWIADQIGLGRLRLIPVFRSGGPAAAALLFLLLAGPAAVLRLRGRSRRQHASRDRPMP